LPSGVKLGFIFGVASAATGRCESVSTLPINLLWQQPASAHNLS
jgi:hypothetical protein